MNTKKYHILLTSLIVLAPIFLFGADKESKKVSTKEILARTIPTYASFVVVMQCAELFENEATRLHGPFIKGRYFDYKYCPAVGQTKQGMFLFKVLKGRNSEYGLYTELGTVSFVNTRKINSERIQKKLTNKKQIELGKMHITSDGASQIEIHYVTALSGKQLPEAQNALTGLAKKQCTDLFTQYIQQFACESKKAKAEKKEDESWEKL